MHPVLIKIGWFELHSYGLLLTMSFLAGIWLAGRRAAARGIQPGFVMDLSVVIVLASILGARALYVVFHLEEFQGRWLDIINPVQSSGKIGIEGLTMLGGVILAILASVAYARRRKIPFLRVADIFAPSIALGIGLTRIGCFLNGCCHGHACSMPWAVTFGVGSAIHSELINVAVHPTQLYASLGGFLIFVSLMVVDRRSLPAGVLFGVFLMLYAISRFVVDLFRHYESSMQIPLAAGLTFSVNQALCVGLFLAGGTIIFYRYGRR